MRTLKKNDSQIVRLSSICSLMGLLAVSSIWAQEPDPSAICRMDQTGIDTSSFNHTTSNIYGGPGVVRTWSAKTLGSGKVNIGGSASGSPWGTRLVNNNLYHFSTAPGLETDSTTVREVVDGAVRPFLAVGIGNYFDLGFVLPIYINKITADDYDALDNNYPYLKDVIRQDPQFGAFGRGDLEVWGKLQYPPYKHSRAFEMAVFGKVTLPSTAVKGKGFIPGESFYIPKDTNLAINAFTAAKPSGVLMMLWTMDLNYSADLPFVLNLNYGLQTNGNADLDNSFLLNGAVEWTLHPSFEVFMEFSGQTRFRNFDAGRNIKDDPLFLTPGFKVKTDNGWSMTFGLDYGLSTKDPSRIQSLYVRDNDGTSQTEYTKYQVLPTRDLGMSAVLAWSGYVVKLDSDNDGTPDSEDLCPRTEAGMRVDNRGCEIDSDDDCVLDKEDKCPATPASVLVYREGTQVGCPVDTDLDGVPDYVDQCAATPPGVGVDVNGCPLDEDKDGVVDFLDRCPRTPTGATVDTLGCILDTDGDGVGDYLDQCAETPSGVKVDAIGCTPDDDKDGVPNYLDRCPSTLPNIKVDSLGCELDTDGDRVVDRLDECPETPEGWTVDKKGCPLDEDKDLVFDRLDKCPGTPLGAKVDTVGCPADTDADGVADYLDKCPETPKGTLVDNVGCPMPVKLKAKIVLRGISFEVGKATLTTDSYEKLNEVAMTLKENPESVIEISGHTDNAGVAKKNDKLSFERAKSVIDYLVGQGLPTSMFVAKGYGSKKPVASNKTPAGKAQNRRIEMMRLK